ncbi:MAG: cation diffusion facilitator family transporter, partial [Desulfuromonadales bacterium]|nr:cation diffusion facilitator family transporter [Desulfuromonadales bacterium]
LAVLSSAIDSLMDILMSGVNLMAIRHAEQPADERHPYGHGKFETLATIFQAVVIAASGVWIIQEAIKRLQVAEPVSQTNIGIVVMCISLVVSFFISRHLKRVAQETDSSALEADSLHFSMDVYTNLALLVGLVLLSQFDLPWLDPGMSILVAIYILFEAARLLRHGMGDILDEQLPQAVRAEIERLIDDHKHDLFGYHNLRTRRAGSQKLIDFHLTVCKDLSVAEAHDITDYIERKIGEHISGTDITIHVEPCRRENCPGRTECATESLRHSDHHEQPWWEGNGDEHEGEET